MLGSCGTTRNRRSLACAATALLVLATAACGSVDGGASGAASSTTPTAPATTAAATVTTQPAVTSTVPPATHTVVAGDSLSAIADAAGVSLDELVAANGWADGINHPIFPGDVVLLPAGAAIGGGTTVPPASTPPTDAETDAASGGYREVGDDRLLSLGPDGATAVVTQPLADGIYFAMRYGLTSDGAGIEFTLARFVSADACIAALGTVPDGTVDPFPCLGGVTDDSVTATVTMPRLSEAPIVLVDDEYRDVEVTAAEFARLLAGSAPAPDAPAWFEYESWPDALVEIRGGAVVRANQRPSS